MWKSTFGSLNIKISTCILNLFWTLDNKNCHFRRVLSYPLSKYLRESGPTVYIFGRVLSDLKQGKWEQPPLLASWTLFKYKLIRFVTWQSNSHSRARFLARLRKGPQRRELPKLKRLNTNRYGTCLKASHDSSRHFSEENKYENLRTLKNKFFLKFTTFQNSEKYFRRVLVHIIYLFDFFCRSC